jgi:hypothetical protein
MPATFNQFLSMIVVVSIFSTTAFGTLYFLFKCSMTDPGIIPAVNNQTRCSQCIVVKYKEGSNAASIFNFYSLSHFEVVEVPESERTNLLDQILSK